MKPNWKKKWMKWIWLRFNSIETEIYFQNWEKKTNTHQWMNENNMKWNANMKKARSRVFFSFFFLLSSICKWTNFGHFDRENTHTHTQKNYYNFIIILVLAFISGLAVVGISNFILFMTWQQKMFFFCFDTHNSRYIYT